MRAPRHRFLRARPGTYRRPLVQGSGETGERFIDPHHPYSVDLDIFGRGSLFELLSTARTRGGEAKLAAWLRGPGSGPVTVDALRERHQAIDELKPLLDLREQLAVLGSDFRVGVQPELLSSWATAPVNEFRTSLRWSAFVLSVLMGAALLWWFATSFVGIEATRVVVVIGAVVGALALSVRNRVLVIAAGISEPAHDLDLLSQILGLLERQSFVSARMAALSGAIRTASGQAASKRIGHLRRLMELLDSRDNVFVRIVGPPLLWTTQTAMAIEAWRAENGALIPAWLDAVSEMEALSSLANYAFEHPDDVFPEFVPDGPPVFEVEDVGHPLLPGERAVPQQRLLARTGPAVRGEWLEYVGQEYAAARRWCERGTRHGWRSGARAAPDGVASFRGRLDSNYGFARRRPVPLHG